MMHNIIYRCDIKLASKKYHVYNHIKSDANYLRLDYLYSLLENSLVNLISYLKSRHATSDQIGSFILKEDLEYA
jgi:hypothetical protein